MIDSYNSGVARKGVPRCSWYPLSDDFFCYNLIIQVAKKMRIENAWHAL